MPGSEPTATYLELRESTEEGEAKAGLSHKAEGLVLLHVLELAAHGEPRGAVTVVHDAGEHGGRYLALAESLAARGWAIALPDLRGHGRSEGARGHSAGIKEILRDLGDVQDHLAYRQPEAPRVVIGQGLGGLYALALALERPGDVAALILAAPLLEPRFELPRSKGGLSGLFKKVGPTTPGSIGWSAAQLTSDPEQALLRGRDELVHDVITLRAAQQASEAAARYAPRLGELSMPVLCIQGASDPIASRASLEARARPPVEVRVLDGCLHDVFHETKRSEIVELVGGWLERAVGSR